MPITFASLWVPLPFYLLPTEDHAACRKVVEFFDKRFSLDIDFSDLDDLTVVEGDYPNWQKILDEFNYAVETEITKVEIASVLAKALDGSGFLEIHEPPTPYRTGKQAAENENAAELAESLKHSMLDIAEDLLAEEGIGSHEKGYLYGVLMDHVGKKMMGGKLPTGLGF
jgi:hypothetical protein